MTWDECTRVYTSPRAKRAHLLYSLDSPSNPTGALCKTMPSDPDGWHGTGSQAEMDHANALPLCQRCERATQ